MANELRIAINGVFLIIMLITFVAFCHLWAHMLNDFNHYSASQMLQPDMMKSFE